MKWKKENKSKLDGPDMDESPESNWNKSEDNSAIMGSKEYREVGGDNQKVLLVENDTPNNWKKKCDQNWCWKLTDGSDQFLDSSIIMSFFLTCQ